MVTGVCRNSRGKFSKKVAQEAGAAGAVRDRREGQPGEAYDAGAIEAPADREIGVKREKAGAHKDGSLDDRRDHVRAAKGTTGTAGAVVEKPARSVRPRRDRGDKKPAA